MSKNIRYKPNGELKTKKKPRRSKPSVTSDDSDYDAVDLVTDSEEDEPDVEEAEEQAIIESEQEDDFEVPQPDVDEHEPWNGFEFDESPDAYFEEQIAPADVPDVFSGASGWIAEAETEDESQPETARRVRFDLSDSDSAPSDAEDNDNDSIFPDIFLDQGSLDPGFRRTIENDHNKDNDDPLSDDGSYWDFDGENEVEVVDEDHDLANNVDESESSSESSSGYETDEGDTTEEELPPAARYLPARNIMRRESTASSSSDDEDVQLIRRNPYRRTGPRLGSWVTDASKPFAVLDTRGKKLVMFKARTGRRNSMNGSSGHPTPLPYMDDEDHDLNGMTQMSPMISNSANMMMSAMYTPMDSLGGPALGPPEAFYPFVSVANNGQITTDMGSSSFDEDDIDDDDLWNIGDLIDFGDEATTDEEHGPAGEEDDSCGSPEMGLPSSTLGRPGTANSDDHNQSLLNHLNSGIVGAFRRNQTRHQLLSRNSASRDSLAFGGRYGSGTIRGIKGGRLAAANTPITPMRKTKMPKVVDPVVSPSPADGKKRKFSSSEPSGHKRVRSLF